MLVSSKELRSLIMNSKLCSLPEWFVTYILNFVQDCSCCCYSAQSCTRFGIASDACLYAFVAETLALHFSYRLCEHRDCCVCIIFSICAIYVNNCALTTTTQANMCACIKTITIVYRNINKIQNVCMRIIRALVKCPALQLMLK